MTKVTKPHKGSLSNWDLLKTIAPLDGLTFYAVGIFVDHPRFAGQRGHTSMIKKITFSKGGAEIETMNSKYTLLPQ